MTTEDKVRVTIVSIPIAWAIYEVDGDLKSLDAGGGKTVPSHVAMEAIVLAGRAKRLAVIQSVGDGTEIMGELTDDDDEEHMEGGGVWFDSGE